MTGTERSSIGSSGCGNHGVSPTDLVERWVPLFNAGSVSSPGGRNDAISPHAMSDSGF